ncbi:MAG: DUF4249 domain-containing protein [Chitinophagales bacterium]
MTVLLLFGGCVKDFNIGGNSTGVTINSVFTDLDTMRLYLTKSTGGNIPPEAMPGISDAKVQLYEDDILAGTMAYVPSGTNPTFGYYAWPGKARAGHRYHVVANGTDFSLSATDTVPPKIPIGVAKIVSRSKNKIHYRFTFSDDYARRDYYRINLWVYGYKNAVDSLGDTVAVAYANALRVPNDGTLADTVRDFGKWLLFSDSGFNGNEKQIDMTFSVADTTKVLNEWLLVELNHVSPAYYDYMRTTNLYYQSSYLSEPVHIYTNVPNGTGAFVGQHVNQFLYLMK